MSGSEQRVLVVGGPLDGQRIAVMSHWGSVIALPDPSPTATMPPLGLEDIKTHEIKVSHYRRVTFPAGIGSHVEILAHSSVRDFDIVGALVSGYQPDARRSEEYLQENPEQVLEWQVPTWIECAKTDARDMTRLHQFVHRFSPVQDNYSARLFRRLLAEIIALSRANMI
jgi:hypothetical protein